MLSIYLASAARHTLLVPCGPASPGLPPQPVPLQSGSCPTIPMGTLGGTSGPQRDSRPGRMGANATQQCTHSSWSWACQLTALGGRPVFGLEIPPSKSAAAAARPPSCPATSGPLVVETGHADSRPEGKPCLPALLPQSQQEPPQGTQGLVARARLLLSPTGHPQYKATAFESRRHSWPNAQSQHLRQNEGLGGSKQ